MSAPERIWLQDGGDYELAKQAMSDLTWCSDPIYEADTEYVRADIHAATLARAERAEARIDFLEGMVMSGQGEQIKLAADLLQAKIERTKERDAREWAEALLAEAVEVINALVDEDCDYMRINNLGDPEKQHNIIRARAILARIQEARHE